MSSSKFARGGRLPVAGIVVLLAAGWSLAGPKVAVTIGVEREIVRTTEDGESEVALEPIEVAYPDDVLVYTLVARNTGDGPALSPRIEDPIPEGTELVLDSVETAGTVPSASLDGGRSWQSFPARVETVDESGQAVDAPAPAGAYTHLRWIFREPIAPGESREVRFKVRVL